MMQSKLIPIAETTKENMAIFLKSESEVEDTVESKQTCLLDEQNYWANLHAGNIIG